MSKRIWRIVGRFVLLMALQLLVLNHVYLGGYVMPMLYVLFILMLPTDTGRIPMLLIAFGANIYQKTINNYEEHFNISTSVAYINEKIRQNDDSGAIELSSFGSSDAFRITSYYNDVKYYTYI